MQRMVVALSVALLGTSAFAGEGARTLGPSSPVGAQGAAKSAPALTSICDLIETSATANGLPVDYFTRLLWSESRFQASAVSPAGAQGIAQFMPGTAAERGLANPFDAYEAIPASAQLLKDLVDRFGNLGLAAAAYNSGPRRVQDWLAGTGGIPRETHTYIAAVTGQPAEHWRALRASNPAASQDNVGPMSCLDTLAIVNAPVTTLAVQVQEADREWDWGVQLAADLSQDKVTEVYRSSQMLYPAILGDQVPLILRKRKLSYGGRPIFHVLVPLPTLQAANGLCGRLRVKGADCIVLKNKRGS